MTEHTGELAVKIDGIGGGPGCGKTTQLRTIQQSARFVCGFVFADMREDIIKWHLDPNNESPLRHVFVAAKKDSSAGKLIGDAPINDAVTLYLYAKDHEFRTLGLGGIRRAFLSGWPRSDLQFQHMLSLDSHAHFWNLHITEARADENRLERIRKGEARDDDKPEVFMDRWTTFRDISDPARVRFQEAHPGQCTTMEFMWSLRKKTKTILSNTRLTTTERSSLFGQINNEGTDAWNKISKIDGVSSQVSGFRKGTPLGQVAAPA